MLFQLRTDNHIRNREGLAEGIQADVESALLPNYAERVHRIEVYLQDLNSKKGGIDKRCAIEAHLPGHQPVTVTHEAPNVDVAVNGAAEKLNRALEHVLGRLEDKGGRVPMSGNADSSERPISPKQ